MSQSQHLAPLCGPLASAKKMKDYFENVAKRANTLAYYARASGAKQKVL
jgi:hypothetical protein